MNIIQTTNLSKRYGDILAIDNVSMNVKQGEIYGFLGLNGAGKTTMIRLLLGLTKPDSGLCELFQNHKGPGNTYWNDVGYLIETPYAYPNLSVRENLQVICKLRGLVEKSVIPEILERLKLQPYKNRKEKNLSLGNKQRLGLAKALIHKPKLLILDEPINGLDPAGIVEVRELLKELAEKHNTTIFLSSHILSEIAKITSRIGIIHNGALIKEIKSSELDSQIIKKLCISTHDNETAQKILLEKGFEASIHHEMLELISHDAINKPEEIATILVQHQTPPTQLFVFKEDLEHYFLRIIRE
ncbi:MAG: ABC transporter ATP-binding protein [Cyclobacteriaceae bacterium]|nr:ABC transporter ATP-binding protein [Cyclobacteriaceae bacterium]